MELVLLEIGCPEWEYAWNWLQNHPINEGIEDPSIALNENESWQYTGSFMQGERVIHSFRHRCFPKGNYVKNLSVSASKTFTTEQIAKKFRL